MAREPPQLLHPQPGGGGAVKSRKRNCKALEPEAWATQTKTCSFCSCTDSAEFKYINNKKVEQPRYKCLIPLGGCGKLFSPNKIRPKRFPNGYQKAYVVQEEMRPVDSSMRLTQSSCHQVQVRDVNVMDTDSLNGASTSSYFMLASKVGPCPDQNWDNFSQELEGDLSSSEDLHVNVLPPSKENGEPSIIITSSSMISPLEGPCLEPQECQALSVSGNPMDDLNDIDDVLFSNMETGEPAAASTKTPALDASDLQFDMDYDVARMWFSFAEELQFQGFTGGDSFL